MEMAKKKPSNYFAPIAVAGLTIGLLVSAYKFVFAKTDQKTEKLNDEKVIEQTEKE